MKSNVDRDYGLKLWFIYKKNIPKNPSFYFVFFIIKFFPIFLLTHNLKGLENNNFGFEKILRQLTLFPQDFSHILILNYFGISILIYCLILFIIFSFAVLLFSYKRFANKNEFQIYKVPSIKFPIPRIMKRFTIFSSWLFLIIVFVSQYLGEYCFVGIFFIYFQPDSNDFDETFMNSFKEFDLSFGKKKYIFGALHILFFIFILLLTFACFLFTSTKTLSHKYGFQTTTMSWSVVVLTLLFQMQGIYSTSMYYSLPFRNTLRFILCCITTFLLSVHVFFTLKTYDFDSYFVFVMKFIGNWCMIAGLLEIVLYFITDVQMSQKMTLIKTVVEIVNAFTLTSFLINNQKKKSFEIFSHKIYVDKERIPPNSLKEYYYLLFKYVNGQDNFLELYNILQSHYYQCSNENCKCLKNIKKSQSLPLTEQKAFFNRLFITIGEQEIVNCIMNYEHKYKIAKMQELILLHVDFLFSIKKNYFLTFYLTHYYLEMKRNHLNIFYKYDLYEIRCLIIEKFKTEKKAPTRIIKTKIIFQSILLSSKHFEKAKSFINIQIFLEKIKIMLYSCCNALEEVINYKDRSMFNSKHTFTCEDLLKVIHRYTNDKNKIDIIIKEYFSKFYISNVEMNYLLKSYFNLIYGEIPIQYRKRINENSIKNYLKDKSISVTDQHLILFLTNDNKLLIRYASLFLVERLHYDHHELIGSEFPDLLPHFLSKYHFAYMKHFLCNGLLTYQKTSFLQTKECNLIPFNIKCKSLPTPMALAMIIKLNEKTNANTREKMFYSILDEQFAFQSISKDFEILFYFNIKMYHAINLNFCQLIGINQDLVTGLFKEEKKKQRKKLLLKAKKEKFFYSLLTSVKPEDYFLFKTARHFKKNTEAATQLLKINKYHSIRAMALLEKQIEGIGLEKESITRIHELYAQLNSKVIDQGRTLTNGINTFLVKFELKCIGDLLYYKTTIKENQCEIINESINVSKLEDTAEHKGIYFLSEKEKFPDLGSLNKSNYSINDSKAGLVLNSKLKRSLRKQPMKIKSKILSTDIVYQRNKLNFIFVIIKIIQFVLFFCLLVLTIANAINNTLTLSDSQAIFYINIYSYLLMNNIYLGSFLCIHNCLVSNKIQSKPMQDISILKQSGTDIIENYHFLLKYINQLINKKEIQKIYDILYSDDPYYLLLPNWKYSSRNDTLGEELYIIYYSFTKFDPQTETDCRIKEYFYGGKFQHEPNDLNSIYERFIFYILANIIKRIGPKIQSLITVSNSLLLDYNGESGNLVIYMNTGVLINGFFLYVSMSFSLLFLYKMLKQDFCYLLEHREYEQDFRLEINKLKHLIVNFNREEVFNFEQSKITNAKENTMSSLKQTQKTKGNQKEIEKEDEEYIGYKTLLKLSRMKIMILTLIIILIGFALFIVVQIGYILFILNWYKKRLTETMLSISFLGRIPKMTELLLYSSISVIFNNMNYMLKNTSDYNDDILSNYYEVELDINSHSLFSKLNTSQFNYIYYQLYIVQKNIEMLLNDVSLGSIIKETTKFENAIYNKEDSCIYPSLYYIKANYTGVANDITTIFTQVNEYSSECRTVSKGINMNGIQLMMDSLISSLTVLYEDFYIQKENERDITKFLTSIIYNNYVDNLQSTLKIIHYDISYLVDKDMLFSNEQIAPIDALFSIASLLFSCGVIFAIIFIFIKKLENNNQVLNEFSTFFEKGLTSFQKNQSKALKLLFEKERD